MLIYVFMWTINIPYSLNLCLYKVVFYFHNIRRKNKPISRNMVLLLEVHLIVVGKYYNIFWGKKLRTLELLITHSNIFPY